MKEDEAKTKWCPYARVIVSERDEYGIEVGHVVSNRGSGFGTVPKNSKCLGSACMAWRWELESQAHGYCGVVGNR